MGWVPTHQSLSVLLQSMVQRSSCLANVELLAVATWDPVDHSFPLVSGDVVFESHQHLLQGMAWLKTSTNLQGGQDPMDRLREVPDVWDHYRGFWWVL